MVLVQLPPGLISGVFPQAPRDLISFDYDASSLTSAQLKFDWAYEIHFY